MLHVKQVPIQSNMETIYLIDHAHVHTLD